MNVMNDFIKESIQDTKSLNCTTRVQNNSQQRNLLETQDPNDYGHYRITDYVYCQYKLLLASVSVSRRGYQIVIGDNNNTISYQYTMVYQEKAQEEAKHKYYYNDRLILEGKYRLVYLPSR